MTDVYKPPFGDYSGAAGQAYDAGAVTALRAAIDNFTALLNTQSNGHGAASPDFNKIDPATRSAIEDEMTALKAAITAHA